MAGGGCALSAARHMRKAGCHGDSRGVARPAPAAAPVIRCCVAAGLRRRWRALLVTVLVLGVLGGASLAAFAGARRTASAYPRFLEAGHPSNLAINNFSGQGSDDSIFDAFPEVERTRTWLAFNLVEVDADGVPAVQ